MSSFRQLMMRNKGGGNIIYAPVLDGTEQITSASGKTPPTISNNILQNGNGWLTEGWDNTVLWQLKVSCKLAIFSYDCGVAIVLPTVTGFDQNDIKITGDCQVSVFNNGSREVNNDEYFKNKSIIMSTSNWLDIIIEKKDQTHFSITIGNYSKEYPFSNLSNTNKLCIGIAQWGAKIQIKDIVVTKIS